ncbi:MAG TPA: RNase H family protein, partial [Candidatus Saccharimonadales bacterium]|nr:RNase H family protein [Candidatus Saccharimonadales bacterium]
LFRQSQATLIWVRGHMGDEGNEQADHWANEARKQRLTYKVLERDSSGQLELL